MKIRFDTQGRLDGITRTPQGGIRATAALTRVGVFTYYNADGSKTRELRHPDDIFKGDALETLRGSPITIGHPGMITPKNFGELAKGHVGDDVRADGRLVKATVYVQDAEGVAFIEKQMKEGKGVELSCGYECDVEKADGSFDGEAYDARQVGHKYNHVAMGPDGWGRAGSEVRITLDEAGHARADSYAADMTVKTDDQKDLQARLDSVQATLDATRGERDALRAQVETLTGENTKLRADLDGEKSSNGKLIDPKEIDARVAKRVSLETRARALVGADAKFDGKTDREVMIEAIVKVAPKFDAKDESDDYVRSRFDSEAERATKADAAVADLNTATKPDPKAPVTDASASPLDAARKKFDEEQAKARGNGPPAGALVRT